jgi:hypothetical protein
MASLLAHQSLDVLQIEHKSAFWGMYRLAREDTSRNRTRAVWSAPPPVARKSIHYRATLGILWGHDPKHLERTPSPG